MPWTPVADPFGRLEVSAILAAIPLVVLFVILARGRLSGWISAMCAAMTSLLLSILAWRMPFSSSLSAALLGVANALFPILWIVIAALWVHALCVESGCFQVIRRSVASITTDRRLQALFIAFAFGAFLEGAAGFGTPVAITAALLVGLGFEARSAATLCLLANSSPVAFAAAGVPIAVAAQVSGLDAVMIGKIVGRQVPLLSLIAPLWLCVVLSGWKRSLEVLPAILVAGLCMSISQLLISNLAGPWTAGVLSGLITVAGLGIFFRVWKPRKIWDFSDAERATDNLSIDDREAGKNHTGFLVLAQAWVPYLLMSLLVLVWSAAPVKSIMQKLDITIAWRGLTAASYTLPLLSTPGTAILFAGILSLLFLPNLGLRKAITAMAKTVKGLAGTIFTVSLILATAYIMNWSGMSSSLGLALAATGPLFPFFSPLIGWVGVLLTGSDTSANALFCSLQATTAKTLGFNPSLMVAANASGGVSGKMISPQSISVATASTKLKGQEGRLLRSTLGHSFSMALIISAITLFQAYVLPGMLP